MTANDSFSELPDLVLSRVTGYLDIESLRNVRYANATLRGHSASILRKEKKQRDHDMELLEVLQTIAPYYGFTTGFDFHPLEEEIDTMTLDEEEGSDSENEWGTRERAEATRLHDVRKLLLNLGIINESYEYDRDILDFFLAEPFEHFATVNVVTVGQWWRLKPSNASIPWYDDPRAIKHTDFPFALSSVPNVHITKRYRRVSIAHPSIDTILLGLRALTPSSHYGPDRLWIVASEGRNTIDLGVQMLGAEFDEEEM